MNRITCEATQASLSEIMAFVARETADARLDAETVTSVRLAAEEVCSNIIRYAYPPGSPGPVDVSVARESGAVIVTVEDRGVPFDPASAPAPLLEGDWQTRGIGGLGWHLVRSVMDEVRYEPLAGGGNRVTLVRRLPLTES